MKKSIGEIVIYVTISCLSKLNICALDKILFLQNIGGQYNPIHTTNIVKYMYDNQLALPGLKTMTDKDTCCIPLYIVCINNKIRKLNIFA